MTPPRPGRLQGPGQLQVGWQYAAAYPDPGPPPRRPTPPEAERLSPEWVAAQRREESQLNRPLKAAFAVAVVLGVVLAALGAAGSLGALLTGLAVTCCALVAAVSGYALWQGERALRSRMAEERARIGRVREAQESRLFAWQAEHAAQMQAWQARKLAYEQQKRWYAVRVPDGVHRVDIAGGTISGWSAMLTTAAASQLPAGNEITVLDLTGSAAALDLAGFARATGTDPLTWVLPGDLPRLDLDRGLGRDALAELLSGVAAAAGEPEADRDPSLDHAILERVIDVLGGQPAIAGVAAGLRALAGDPGDDVAAGLITAAQATRLTALAGRGSGARAVLERAWVLESRLRKLAAAGTGLVPLPRSKLRVIALDRRVGTVSSRMLGTYLTAALTHLLRGTPPGPRWRHTLFVLGADKLRDGTLDRLSDACERSATGLVLAYRTITGHVRPRLGRGNAVVAFMRLADAEDARAASDQLGAGHRLVLAQLTEAIGASVADTADGTYTSTAGEAGASAAGVPPAAGGSSRGAGRLLLPEPAGDMPPAYEESVSKSSVSDPGTSRSEPVSAAIRTNTGWGMTTAKATADSESLAEALKRSRDFLAGPDELRGLPASAMIISYPAPGGVLADANPGIGGLSSATPLTLEEFRARPAKEPADPAGQVSPADGSGASAPDTMAPPPVRPAPNLGPPPRRLDWRRGRS
ncbi:MAG TPA: hypothetical protein VFV73_13590 [Streptosporangiaceae bacterium]|nr:hypothetical protein [Streptosporangiaceae bacterium]